MTPAGTAAEDRSAFMLGEALHRFSNHLQLIVSAFNAILRDSEGEARVRKGLASLQGRVSLMARVNRMLSGPFGPDATSAEALEQLCAALAAAFDRHDVDVGVSVVGAVATPEARRTVLLLAAELMTNALKHGGPGRPLRARLDIDATGRELRLRFASDTPAERAGLRPRMAAELAAAVGGVLSVADDARSFDVEVSLPQQFPTRLAN